MLIKTFVIFCIRIYQKVFRELFRQVSFSLFGFQTTCKYSPTCSEYMILQVKKHGTIVGLRKGLARFLSCY